MEQAQVKLVFSIFLIAFLLVPSVQAKNIRYCDKKGNYGVKVSNVDINPDPVVSGKPATFTLFANTDQPIDGGQLVIEVSFFGVHVHTEKHNLCDETSCPVSPGDFQTSHTQVLPSITPPGNYNLKMKLVDGNKKQLTCVVFDFKIVFAPLVSDM